MTERPTVAAIGPDTVVWPPQFDQTHDRAKGLYDTVIDSDSAVQHFAYQMHTIRGTVAEQCSRLSVRAVIETERLSALEHAVWQAGIQVEAAIPLSGLGDSLAIAYTGWNAPERMLQQTWFERHVNTLNRAVSRPPTRGRPLELGVGFIDQRTPEATRRALIPQFAGIYALFGYAAGAAEQLLLNPANIVAYVHDDNGDVVSTAMAAYERPYVSGMSIPMVEITEAFTVPEYRGNGLYRTVSGHLTQALADRETISAIYGEGNLAMPGVIIAAHENNRQFSYHTRERFGIRNTRCGILAQAVRIEDGRAESERLPYNDLAVSYLSPEN